MFPETLLQSPCSDTAPQVARDLARHLATPSCPSELIHLQSRGRHLCQVVRSLYHPKLLPRTILCHFPSGVARFEEVLAPGGVYRRQQVQPVVLLTAQLAHQVPTCHLTCTAAGQHCCILGDIVPCSSIENQTPKPCVPHAHMVNLS